MKSLPLPAFLSRHEPLTVWTLRILVGAVFTVSGLAKSIDIFGFVFKIEEYLAVWGFTTPRSLVVLGALILSGAEFVLGLMLMLGAYKRSSVWLLLLQMCFMLPLTAYIAIADPVSDCGCFGDLFRLSNTATLLKNIVLTAALLLLVGRNSRVKGVYHAYTQWLVAAVSSLYILAVALYGFNIQPLVDFRSFPPGSPIVADIDAEEAEDEAEFAYVYEKAGERRTFTLDNLPDSTWTFVSRDQISGADVRRDATVLNIYDRVGDNMTDEAIATEGEQLIIVIPQAERASVSGTYAINELQRYLEDKDGSVIELIATDPADLDDWRDRSMASLPVYLAEETTLKELSRGDISAVFTRDGIIRWKRTLPTIDVDEIVSGQISLDDYATDGRRLLLIMTLMLVFTLCFIYLLDASRKIIAWRDRRREKRAMRQEKKLEKKTRKKSENL